MTVYVGTSGWQYRHWLGRFYPRKPRLPDELSYYAQRFQTVEVNGTFYRLPEGSTFEDWAARVPEDFVFAIKASRFLTHIKRLRDPEEPVGRLMSRAAKLGGRLGPVLIQLPADFRLDLDRLRSALEAFDRAAPGTRVAVEFRHASWFCDGVRSLLGDRNAALCLADRGSRMVTPAWRTADWGYLRFHEGHASPRPCYGITALASRADMVRDLYGPRGDVYAYFNNDPLGCALRDARAFAAACSRRRLQVSRSPGRQEVSVG
jgi:uncharacterized protein YecE (DUF72 family)